VFRFEHSILTGLCFHLSPSLEEDASFLQTLDSQLLKSSSSATVFAPVFTLVLAASLSLSATAAPLVARNIDQTLGSRLAPRSSTERVFLAYCLGGYPGSEMLYYSNDAESRTGQKPDDVAFINPDAAILSPFEGHTVVGIFPSGEVFTTEITPGAENIANFAYAGTGQNQYHQFSCYKDDNRLLWQGMDGEYEQACYSQYYCKDVRVLLWRFCGELAADL